LLYFLLDGDLSSPTMDPRTKRLDALWRDAVRARDGERCQYRSCKNVGTAAHHIFSRRHKATRWDPENGILLCFYCHIRIAHEDPEIFRDFLMGRFPPGRFEKLKMRAMGIMGKIDWSLVEMTLNQYIKEVKGAATKETRAGAVVGRS